MTYRITLPEEDFILLEYKYENLPCICLLNKPLGSFEPRDIFVWHLSLIIDFDETIENGMPSKKERVVVDAFCERLNSIIKSNGNAIFLLRETWNDTRRLVWRVYDAEIANDQIQKIIKNQDFPRDFDYNMKQDLEWAQVDWYFKQLNKIE